MLLSYNILKIQKAMKSLRLQVSKATKVELGRLVF